MRSHVIISCWRQTRWGHRNRVTRSNFLLVGTCPAGPHIRLRACEVLRFPVFQTDRCSCGIDAASTTGLVDFSADSSYFYKSYYNPEYKASSYILSRESIDSLHILINQANFTMLDTLYEPRALDLPVSTLTIVWDNRKFKIVDNGLQGAPVLEKIYALIYKY